MDQQMVHGLTIYIGAYITLHIYYFLNEKWDPFFFISNKTFIEKKIELHVHDGEHFEQWNKYKKIKS